MKTQAEKDWETLFRNRLKGYAVLRVLRYMAPLYVIAFFADVADNLSDVYSHPPLIAKLIGGFFLFFFILAFYVIFAGIYTSIKTGYTPKRSSGTGTDGT